MDAFRRVVREWPGDDRWQIDFDLVQGRAGAGSAGRRKTGIGIQGTDDGIEVYVHEMGHAMSDSSEELLQDAVDFLYYRTKDYDLVKLSDAYPGHGYGAGEVTRVDEFLHPYMGKEYSSPRRYAKRNWGEHSTFVQSPYNVDDIIAGEEIVSMGIQYIFENSIILAQRDPEYFDFIFNKVMYRGLFD